jgi:hypothetical protein
VISCRKTHDVFKEDKNLAASTTDNQNLLGLNYLLSLNGLKTEFKDALNINDYKYYSKGDNDKLWIVALNKHAFGFEKAKLIASIKNGKSFSIIASFNYDESLYQTGNFNTYTGTTTIYNQEIKEIKTFRYEKGALKEVIFPPCSNCSMVQPLPPDDRTNWCLVLPALCDYQGGEGTDPNDPTTPMMPPEEGGGGGNSSGTGYPTVVNQLTSLLSLNSSQSSWLAQGNNVNRAYEIYAYLQNSSESNKNQISIYHINQMMNDPDYLSFVVNHAATGDPYTIWWEDDSWLSNSSNLNLDIDATNNQYDELTQAEKELIKRFPVEAYRIRRNADKAISEAQNKFPNSTLLNDKGDAFRHAFWMALNQRDCGQDQQGNSIAYQFGVAHESEDPTVLHLEKEMDLFNNGIGIGAGSSYNFPIFVSDATVSNDIYQKLLNGELKYLAPLDFNLSLPYDINPHDHIQDCPTCLDGILPNTILKPTNQ